MGLKRSILREKLYMIIGNVGTEGVAVRDRIFIQMDGICQMMISDIVETQDVALTEKICWVLSVLMKEEPVPDVVIVSFFPLTSYSSNKFSMFAKLFRIRLTFLNPRVILIWIKYNSTCL
jgi:hypothetical protein